MATTTSITLAFPDVIIPIELVFSPAGSGDVTVHAITDVQRKVTQAELGVYSIELSFGISFTDNKASDLSVGPTPAAVFMQSTIPGVRTSDSTASYVFDFTTQSTMYGTAPEGTFSNQGAVAGSVTDLPRMSLVKYATVEVKVDGGMDATPRYRVVEFS